MDSNIKKKIIELPNITSDEPSIGYLLQAFPIALSAAQATAFYDTFIVVNAKSYDNNGVSLGTISHYKTTNNFAVLDIITSIDLQSLFSTGVLNKSTLHHISLDFFIETIEYKIICWKTNNENIELLYKAFNQL